MNQRNSQGQGMVEYIILVAIIAVASLGIVKVLGHTVTTRLSKITLALQGKSDQARSIEEPRVERKHHEKRDMDDFYESAEE